MKERVKNGLFGQKSASRICTVFSVCSKVTTLVIFEANKSLLMIPWRKLVVGIDEAPKTPLKA
jgi:hypothetical protein